MPSSTAQNWSAQTKAEPRPRSPEGRPAGSSEPSLEPGPSVAMLEPLPPDEPLLDWGFAEAPVATARELAEVEATRRFDLAAGNVLRIRLWRAAPDEHVLLDDLPFRLALITRLLETL